MVVFCWCEVNKSICCLLGINCCVLFWGRESKQISSSLVLQYQVQPSFHGVYSPLLQHHLYIFVFVYIILLKVVSIVLHLQLSGSSSSPGSFRSFQRAALQAGHLWGSHKRAGNRPKKCGFTARFLEKRRNMINPRPGMKLVSI